MKGALVKQIGKNIAISFVLATVGTTAFYYGVVKRRRDVYAEWHRTVDPDAMYERMKSKGVFWAFKAIEEEPTEEHQDDVEAQPLRGRPETCGAKGDCGQHQEVKAQSRGTFCLLLSPSEFIVQLK